MVRMGKNGMLRNVVNRTRALFHKLGQAGARIHATDLPAMGKRAVLEDLHRNGPQTVPQMARKRPVSRQHILQLVNPLEQEGYVTFAENPDHKKSFLVELTKKGRKKIAGMMEKEEAVYSVLASSLNLKDLTVTVKTLARIEELLEGERFDSILEEIEK